MTLQSSTPFTKFYRQIEIAKLLLLGILSTLTIADAARTIQQPTSRHLASTGFAVAMTVTLVGSLHQFQKILIASYTRYEAELVLQDYDERFGRR